MCLQQIDVVQCREGVANWRHKIRVRWFRIGHIVEEKIYRRFSLSLIIPHKRGISIHHRRPHVLIISHGDIWMLWNIGNWLYTRRIHTEDTVDKIVMEHTISWLSVISYVIQDMMYADRIDAIILLNSFVYSSVIVPHSVFSTEPETKEDSNPDVTAL